MVDGLKRRAYSWVMIARIVCLFLVASILSGCFAFSRQPVHSRSQAQISAEEQEAEASEWLNKAMQLYHDGAFLDPDDALLSLDQAVRLDPKLVLARYNRALILANKGRDAEALEDVDAVIALRPDMAEAHFMRGSLLVRLRRFVEASAEYGLTTRIDPTFAQAFTQRGLIAAQNGDNQSALDDFTQAIALEPDQYLPYFNRSLALVEMDKDSEALVDLNQAVTLRPNSVEARVARAEILLRLGQFQRAVGDYTWAARLETDSHLIQEGLARAMIGAGDRESGARVLARAMALAKGAGDLDAATRYEAQLKTLHH